MIILSQENTDIWVKIDKKIKPLIENYKWKINSQGYPVAWVEKRQILLSRYIIELNNISVPDGHIVSYKNMNRLDNRLKNLQIIPKNQNKKK